jgi:hypothetical protein
MPRIHLALLAAFPLRLLLGSYLGIAHLREKQRVNTKVSTN